MLMNDENCYGDVFRAPQSGTYLLMFNSYFDNGKLIKFNECHIKNYYKYNIDKISILT